MCAACIPTLCAPGVLHAPVAADGARLRKCHAALQRNGPPRRQRCCRRAAAARRPRLFPHRLLRGGAPRGRSSLHRASLRTDQPTRGPAWRVPALARARLRHLAVDHPRLAPRLLWRSARLPLPTTSGERGGPVAHRRAPRHHPRRAAAGETRVTLRARLSLGGVPASNP
jgi:hypothetical protein